MPKITFKRKGEVIKTVEIKPGAPLWDAKEEGIQFVEEPNCEGEGRCQKCKAIIDGREKLSCQEKVWRDDMEIEVMTYYN